MIEDITVEICEHNWVFCDDSFDHDWAGGGTHVDCYWECQTCGVCTRKCPAELIND